MAIRTYTGGQLPKEGDYVRSTLPTGPVHGLVVYRVEGAKVAALEDVTHQVRTLDVWHLQLIHRDERRARVV
jgi:hypothetical protein